MNKNTTKIQVTLSSNHNQSNAQANFVVPGCIWKPDTTSFRCMYVRSSSNTHPACSSSKEQPACKRKHIWVMCLLNELETLMFLSQDIWVMMKIVMLQPRQDIVQYQHKLTVSDIAHPKHHREIR